MSKEAELHLNDRTFDEICFASSNKLSVLLLGETGTGKSYLAKKIHQLSKNPFPFVNYQASARNLDIIASELFGYKKGAFTGAFAEQKGLLEEADGGTLFIDEIDSLNYEAQNLLLHALQEKKYRKLGETKERKTSFRLISASNKPLKNLIASGILREDFMHRIAQICIELPPLRLEKEKLIKFAHSKLIALREKEKLTELNLSEEAQHKLLTYGWPGNIRELEHCIAQAAHRAHFKKRNYILCEDIKLNYQDLNSGSAFDFRGKVKNYELDLIKNALQISEGNQTRAAADLNLDRSTLRRILARAEK